MPTTSDSRYSPRNFIKGKIGELVFEEMFRKAGEYTVLPFGYERTLPEMAQYAHLAEYKPVLENIRRTPDFALISNDKKKIYLVEVKYRKTLGESDLVEMAERIREVWHPVWLFVATQERFYFASCSSIISSGGEIAPLGEDWVKKEIQDEYLQILKEFIR